MPATAALTEFNRNPNALIEELQKTKQPTYLTKNGKACAVIMDPEAFEHAMSFRAEVREREMRVYQGILRGYEEALQGETVPAHAGLAELRRKKGWE